MLYCIHLQVPDATGYECNMTRFVPVDHNLNWSVFDNCIATMGRAGDYHITPMMKPWGARFALIPAGYSFILSLLYCA